MPNDGSVTRWINEMRLGDSVAVRQLWQRYFQRLVGLARKKLSDTPRGVADEEDVALSAFDSVCRRAEQGGFPNLSDRDGLWKLLVVITARKAGFLRREQMALKRGAGQTNEANGSQVLEELLSREPDPALAAATAEEHGRLMDVLESDELRLVAQRRMEGYSVEEIATQLGIASRSIKRKLQLIREIWERELMP